MKYNTTSKFVVAALCSLAYAQAFAGYVNVVESRLPGGTQNPLYTQNGPGPTSAESTATPLPGWLGGTLTTGGGSYYAGQTTPAKYGDWSFTPGTGYGGYYDVYATWAVNTYATNVPNPIWTVHSVWPDLVISLYSQTNGGNSWNLLGLNVRYNDNTTYTTHLETIPDGQTGKRTYFDSVAWAASTPWAPVNYSTGINNGATDVVLTGSGNELRWAPGAGDSFFNLYLGTSSGSLTKIADKLSEATLTFDLDSQNLQAGTQYFWRVDGGNVDMTTPGIEWSFTTIPEPSTAVLSLLGGLGLAGWISRRRTA